MGYSFPYRYEDVTTNCPRSVTGILGRRFRYQGDCESIQSDPRRPGSGACKSNWKSSWGLSWHNKIGRGKRSLVHHIQRESTTFSRGWRRRQQQQLSLANNSSSFHWQTTAAAFTGKQQQQLSLANNSKKVAYIKADMQTKCSLSVKSTIFAECVAVIMVMNIGYSAC